MSFGDETSLRDVSSKGALDKTNRKCKKEGTSCLLVSLLSIRSSHSTYCLCRSAWCIFPIRATLKIFGAYGGGGNPDDGPLLIN